MDAPGIGDFDISHLQLLQRILVTTDGTVTDMLSAAFLEPVVLVPLEVAVRSAVAPIEALRIEAGTTTMHRRVILRGARTGTHYAYAETIIATDTLTPAFREDLLAGQTPLGQLWLLHRVETWKERPVVVERAAGAIGAHLNLPATAKLIARTYRTFAGGRPIFLVTEWFPVAYPVQPA